MFSKFSFTDGAECAFLESFGKAIKVEIMMAARKTDSFFFRCKTVKVTDAAFGILCFRHVNELLFELISIHYHFNGKERLIFELFFVLLVKVEN